MRFYVGLHQPSDARHFPDGHCFLSVNRLRGRKKPLGCKGYIIDSGAFTELAMHGRYRHAVAEYARDVADIQWRLGVADAVVSQDYMCEPFMLEKTGMTVRDHQDLTTDRYLELRDSLGMGARVMPVLQGFKPAEYARHVRDYGNFLKPGMWVGVGSVCKRQGDYRQILAVLNAIREVRPDLRLHGFGVKTSSLPYVADKFYSADSMAWSYAARKQGRNGNDWREAQRFAEMVEGLPVQVSWC